jgi:methylated-DNA-[protein]-cysteine S-methyltransferase
MNTPRRFVLDRLVTPIGTMLVVTDCDGALRALDWEDHEPRMHRLFRLHYGQDGVVLEEGLAPAAVRSAIDAYFDGDLSAIEALPVATGGTVFQREVWSALREIPAGETVSYGALARKIARPAAVRAVGLANGANPIGVVVPCHRVVGADSTLTGYAGGVERKRWLLTHEGVGRETHP